MRTSLLMWLALFGLGGCDPVLVGLDANADGAIDANADAGLVIAPPAAPALTPCPAGWHEIMDASGVVTCDAYPASGPADCTFGEAHWPGAAGCAPVGTDCAADGWPSDLPSGQPILYVDDDAAPGGTGATRATALRTMAEAISASSPGGVIAVATGTYDEAITLARGQTLWGACVSGTRIATSAPSASIAALTLSGNDVGARNLGIDAPERVGIITTGSGVMIRSVVVSSARTVGLGVRAGSATATDVVVQGTREQASDRTLGRGIDVEGGGQLVLSRAVVQGNRDFGLVVGPGSGIDASDVVVRGTLEQLSDGRHGRGISVQGGGHATLARALLADNLELDVFVDGAGTTMEATDVVLRGTRERVMDHTFGRGIDVERGAHLTLSRVLVVDNREMGVSVGGVGSQLDASDVVVSGTRERADGLGGHGFHAQDGGALGLVRALAYDNREGGLVVDGAGTSVTASDLAVQATSPRAAGGALGAGIWAQNGAHVVLMTTRITGSHGVAIASVLGSSTEAHELVVAGVGPAGTIGGHGAVALSGATLALTRFSVLDATLCGVLVGDDGTGPSATGLDLVTGLVDRASVGACVQVDAYDATRLMNDVEYREVGTTTMATTYVVPTPL